MNIKHRITSGWTLQRILFVAMGAYVITESIINHQYIGILFGGYFASMGLFAFGCAAGNCYGGQCEIDPKTTEKKQS